MSIAERNESAKYYVTTRLNLAETLNDEEFCTLLEQYPQLIKMLTQLIEVNAKGFRGVVATALVGLYLKPDYNPLTEFYACNPRAIFEDGIWYALTAKGIPCGKSALLNVAKNINRLDLAWAQGKRPEASAVAAVEFLQLIMGANTVNRNRLIDYFFYRLLHYTQSLQKHVITSVSTTSANNHVLAEQLSEFCLQYPEAGAVPQYLVAKLLSYVYQNSSVNVQGGDESVFGTNTTSKKPADIWLVENHQVIRLYEITVKKVTHKRLDDCLASLIELNLLEPSVYFICRVPCDLEELPIQSNYYLYKGKVFNFIDIQEFITVLCAVLTPQRLESLLQDLSEWLSNINISPKTKQGWNSIFPDTIS